MPYNWNPVVKSALQCLINEGLEVFAVDNGGGKVKTPTLKEAVEEVTACDEANVYVRPLLTREPEGVVWLVLGNEPEELFCDYSCHKQIDRAQAVFSEKWEGVRCPLVKK